MNSPVALRNNNFDFLRVLFAVIVFFVHAYILSQSDSLAFIVVFLSSEIAVKSFFVISGFLIFMSYENSSSLNQYFSKRFRRIYPAYFSVIMLCALMGAFVSHYSLENYFTLEWLKYITANLVFLNFLHPNLPGVFVNQSFSAVNGALWTLKIEVMFYLSVPIVVWMMRRWGKARILLFLYILSHAYVFMVGLWGASTDSHIYLQLQRQLPGELSFFIAGAALYYYLDFFKRNYHWMLLSAFTVMLVRYQLPVSWLEPISIAIIVIYFACIFHYLGHFGKYGDFSYGIYIVHFPILQFFISQKIFDSSPFFGLFMASFCVFVLAFIFWHMIEKPFLRKRSHYVKMEYE